MGRYEKCKTAIQIENGEAIQYLERRFLPKGEEIGFVGETQIGDGERLDQLANRTVGDPLLYWKLADANNAMNPYSLVDSPTIKIPKKK